MGECRFLIDVNLPRFFSLWNNAQYIHQADLGDEWSDTMIWQHAKAQNLTIITKDSDFSSRILLHTPPPKVIHIRLGNMKCLSFTMRLIIMARSCFFNKNYKLVNVFVDRIEGIT